MKIYTIRELSEISGVPASTLRYYEDIGLLTGVERNENHQRIYTDAHAARLNAIGCFKNAGFTITGIRRFFELEEDLAGNIDGVISLISACEEDLCRQMEREKQALCHLRHKLRYYCRIKSAIETRQPWPCWEDC